VVPEARPVTVNTVTIQREENGENSISVNVTYEGGGCVGTPSFFVTKNISTTPTVKAEFTVYVSFSNPRPCESIEIVKTDLNLGMLRNDASLLVNGVAGATNTGVSRARDEMSCW